MDSSLENKGMDFFFSFAQLNENNRKAYKLASLLLEQDKTYTEIGRELNENGYKTPNGKQYKCPKTDSIIQI